MLARGVTLRLDSLLPSLRHSHCFISFAFREWTSRETLFLRSKPLLHQDKWKGVRVAKRVWKNKRPRRMGEKEGGCRPGTTETGARRKKGVMAHYKKGERGIMPIEKFNEFTHICMQPSTLPRHALCPVIHVEQGAGQQTKKTKDLSPQQK